MFSMEFLAWWSLAVSICAAVLAGAALFASRKADLQLRAELDWEKGLRRDLSDRLNATGLIVHDLGVAAGFKLARQEARVRPNSWEKAL